jgi:hypothetical protein
MYRWILLCPAKFYFTIVASTLKRGLCHGIVVNLRILCLDLSLMEHGLQRNWLVVALAVEELYLQEIMAIIEVVSDEIANELLDNHSLLILHVSVKALN